MVTEDVGHEALWLALVNEVRQPRAHALNCSVTNLALVHRKRLSSIGNTQPDFLREEGGWEVVSVVSLMAREPKIESALGKNVLGGF